MWGEDIEESILRQNVPGRYSRWVDEGDKRQPGGAEDDGDEQSYGHREDEGEEGDGEVARAPDPVAEQRRLVEEGVPDPIRWQIAAQRDGMSKTGVKGVLADYKEHQALKRAITEQERLQRRAVLTRMAEGYKEDPQIDAEPEDDFMQQYRRKRLLELQSTSAFPMFGVVKDVTAFEFVDEVDKEDVRVCVCVHIYDPSEPCCVRMAKYLNEISRKHPRVKFLRMLASEAQSHTREGFDRWALPTLVVYRGGNVMHTLPRVQEELGEAFTSDDVEWLLETHDLFEVHTHEIQTHTQVQARAYAQVLNDDEDDELG